MEKNARLKPQEVGMPCSVVAIMWSGSTMQHDAGHYPAGLGTLVGVGTVLRIVKLVDATDLGIWSPSHCESKEVGASVILDVCC